MGRVALVIVDGIGLAPPAPGNVVGPEHLPTLFAAMDRHGHAVLEASGPPVGLYPGQVGNSEVGHLTIGAGRVLPSMLARIDMAFETGTWARHPAWGPIAEAGTLHVVGLLSDAGVHAHWSTIVKAVRTARGAGVERIVVHPVLDGVDSGAGRAGALLDELAEALAGDDVRMGVVMGRKWFCDRSGALDVTATYADAVREGTSLPAFSRGALDDHLAASGNESDFPAHLVEGGPRMRAGEPVLHTSHRADRAVQAVELLARSQIVHTMVTVAAEEVVPTSRVVLPVAPIEGGLADALEGAGLRSARIAETCKFPHVTYFMNGYRERVGEERHVEVPAGDPDLARHPAMSVEGVAEATERALADEDIALTIVNLANLDQVGHLGDVEAAKGAARAVEGALARIDAVARPHGVTQVLMADHGNADRIEDAEGRPFVGHTEMPVPFAIVPAQGAASPRWRRRTGSLADVAPTVLALLGVRAPAGMGEPLVDPLTEPAGSRDAVLRNVA